MNVLEAVIRSFVVVAGIVALLAAVIEYTVGDAVLETLIVVSFTVWVIWAIVLFYDDY